MDVMKKIVFISMLCILFVGCDREKVKDEGLDILGSWHLTELNPIETRSVTLGQESVDVYLDFASDNTFKLYQLVGAGKYRCFSGTWLLEENTLSGVYDDNTAWGSSYQVTLSGDNNVMTLTSVGEEYIYTKESIPASVLSNTK